MAVGWEGCGFIVFPAGCTVYLVNLNEDAINATGEVIKKESGKAVQQPLDVIQQQKVGEASEKIGKVAILVNRADVSHVGTIA